LFLWLVILYFGEASHPNTKYLTLTTPGVYYQGDGAVWSGLAVRLRPLVIQFAKEVGRKGDLDGSGGWCKLVKLSMDVGIGVFLEGVPMFLWVGRQTQTWLGTSIMGW
jgi:hypothetical protein